MFNLELKINILESHTFHNKGPKSKSDPTASVIIKYRLDFDNTEYVSKLIQKKQKFLLSFLQMTNRVNKKPEESQLGFPNVTTELLLELFPFGILINKEVKISGYGEKLAEAFINANYKEPPDVMIGSFVTEYFEIRRPLEIDFTFETLKNVS